MSVYAKYLANIARDLLVKWYEDEMALENEYPLGKEYINRLNEKRDILSIRIDFLERRLREGNDNE